MGTGCPGFAGDRGILACMPSMNLSLEVEALPESGHRDRREPQLRKGDRPWEGSGERSDGATYRNRIRGAVERGERARNREASMTKAQAA